MNKIIENLKLKKIIIIYLILVIVSIVGITLFLGNKYFNKIEYLYNYHKISEMFDENYNLEYIEDSLSNLSKKSDDIVDAVIINNDKILFSTNNKYKNNLVKLDNTKNYYKDDYNNIYELEDKEDFALSLFSLNRHDDDYYNEFSINSNNNYIVTYLKNDTTNDKIIIINKITPVQNGHLYLKVSLSILVLFFMIYWIITSLMIYQNALKIKLNAYFWGILTLFTNVIGVLIYLIYKNNRITCNECNTSNEKNNIYCINCGNKINDCCTKCHNIINKKEKYCKSCVEKN